MLISLASNGLACKTIFLQKEQQPEIWQTKGLEFQVPESKSSNLRLLLRWASHRLLPCKITNTLKEMLVLIVCCLKPCLLAHATLQGYLCTTSFCIHSLGKGIMQILFLRGDGYKYQLSGGFYAISHICRGTHAKKTALLLNLWDA